MILTNDKEIYKKAKHITTTAKVMKGWSWEHDRLGFNYRLPNLNAALGVGQIEILPDILRSKRIIAKEYKDFCKNNSIHFIDEPNGTKANFWLNSIVLEDRKERDKFLQQTNEANIGTRPLWRPIHELELEKNIKFGHLENTLWLYDRVVSLPSSAILELQS